IGRQPGECAKRPTTWIKTGERSIGHQTSPNSNPRMHHPRKTSMTTLLEADPSLFDLRSSSAGPTGSLPLTEELLRHAPSGDLFGWSQNVGMGWRPDELGRRGFLLLSTPGGSPPS